MKAADRIRRKKEEQVIDLGRFLCRMTLAAGDDDEAISHRELTGEAVSSSPTKSRGLLEPSLVSGRMKGTNGRSFILSRVVGSGRSRRAPTRRPL
jgi:hypothetical protein